MTDHPSQPPSGAPRAPEDHESDCHASPLPRRTAWYGPDERDLLRRLVEGGQELSSQVTAAAVGSRFVAVQAGERLGLGSTLGAAPAPGDKDLAAELVGRELGQCCELVFSLDPLRASLGLAALNAACPAPPADRMSPGTAQDWLLEKARDRKVVLVGEFPFGPDLAQAAASLHLLELKPGAATLRRSEWAEVVADSDLLAVSGTALLTGMMAFFLSKASRAAKVVIGPSTPMSPILFQAGAHALAGNAVSDPDAVLQGVSQGLPYKILKRTGLKPVLWFED